ncbi:MAG: hypothetical protein V2I34_08095 [Bacteroidales bacterium]|nr:hypothetical protein [Bacteroidales bacterium]
MVLRITKIVILPFIVSMCLLTSCEDLYMVDCNECTYIEPKTCLLRIELGNEFNNPEPYEVTIYRGTLEDGVVVFNEIIYNVFSFNYSVSINTEYTVTASVEKNGTEYVAVDATTPRTRRIEDVCEETCYLVVDNSVDLEFKYY